MLENVQLTDQLSEFETSSFGGHVFRCTFPKGDPLRFSIHGGRWAIPASDTHNGIPVLYTSLEKEGAISELAAWWTQQTPVPQIKMLVSEIKITASKVISLNKDDLAKLGVNMNNYSERNYNVTSKIGEAVNFMEYDAMITPSARWPCNNLTVFDRNHCMDETLEIIYSEEFDWHEWAKSNDVE